ncbi:carboxy terminal-processing peptidase [Winogradskyella sp. A3E31]|uniref:carboxy terminal-processing peptidase n=1 Tax=Winogradskyella sp. A3E31 TaxID=3349637 RepID=UPI00398A8A09
MKGNYKFLLLAVLIAFASCSFTSKTFDDPDKDKMLIQIITYVLDQGHIAPQDLNDEFSEKVFQSYVEQLDPLKRYFYQSDMDDFAAYRSQIDDQLKSYEFEFFNLTYSRLLERIAESKDIYNQILDEPFDFSQDEEYNADYEALPYVKNKRQMKERWEKQLKFATISNYDEAYTLNEELEDDEKKSLEELEKEARETTRTFLDELYDNFINERDREDWFVVYVNAAIEIFDPHTYYFAPEDKERFDVRMTGKFEGIGARLQKRMDVISVNEVISGGPAWKQGELEVGDQILKVKQEDEEEPMSVLGMRLEDAIKFIKGPKGTKVTLTLKKVDGTIEDITITRDVVELEETYAKSSTVIKDDKKYGIIDLPSFYVNFDDYKNERNAATDVKLEIERLKKEGIEGLILDVRNNGGGSLQTVVDMVGLFIKDGPVVQVKTTGEPKEVLKDADQSITWDGPLVVLVNEASASASEILAAAVQDYKRGIVIGSQQTYGKGSVQTIIDLNRMVRNNSSGDMGALKFTTQKYYRIDGGSTQLEGVKSDIIMPDRYKYIGISEGKIYDNPLPWDKIDAAEYSVWENYYDYDAAIENSRKRLENNEQLQLIDNYAKWINTIRERDNFSLRYEDYKARLEANQKEAERFEKISDYKTNLTFNSLPYELDLIEKDSVLRDRRARWHTSLTSDVYVEEALNVLNDLKLSYAIKPNVASSVKN